MQEINNAKQESSVKSAERRVKCPNCGHTIFSRTLVEPVEIIETEDIVTDVIADEPKLVNEFYCCIKCGSILNLDSGVGNDALSNGQEVIGSIDSAQSNLARYAACVFVPADIVEVRQLPCGKSTWHEAGGLAEAAGTLLIDNQHGQHVYVGANPRRVKGGTRSKDVSCARCLFIDLDGIGPDAAKGRWHNAGLPKPTLTIASGHGVHA